jgi:hypothetical protein
MHLAQALVLFPLASLIHCKLGYLRTLVVGLYLPRSFLRRQANIEPLPQIAQVLAIF